MIVCLWSQKQSDSRHKPPKMVFCTHVFCPVVSFIFIFYLFLFSSPNLSDRRLDVYHTCTQDVASVRIENACLKCAARGSLEIQDAKKLPLRHESTIGKENLLNSNTCSTCRHNMVNVGPLTAEIGSGIYGTPANFNGFRVLAALLHSIIVVGVSQTLRR